MGTILDRFAERDAPKFGRALGRSWTHTNGEGVSRLFAVIYRAPFVSELSVENSAPSILVLTSQLSDAAVGDTWTDPAEVDHTAIAVKPDPRPGFTRIDLKEA